MYTRALAAWACILCMYVVYSIEYLCGVSIKSTRDTSEGSLVSKLLFVLSNVEEWILSFFRDREIFLNFRGWGGLRGIILIHLF